MNALRAISETASRSGLVLRVEVEQGGDLPGALAGEDDVALGLDRQGDEPERHAASRITTTVVSS